MGEKAEKMPVKFTMQLCKNSVEIYQMWQISYEEDVRKNGVQVGATFSEIVETPRTMRDRTPLSLVCKKNEFRPMGSIRDETPPAYLKISEMFHVSLLLHLI